VAAGVEHRGIDALGPESEADQADRQGLEDRQQVRQQDALAQRRRRVQQLRAALRDRAVQGELDALHPLGGAGSTALDLACSGVEGRDICP